jgi:hypothetical protein
MRDMVKNALLCRASRIPGPLLFNMVSHNLSKETYFGLVRGRKGSAGQL